ncbi:MAG: serine/threonine protein kinase [Planctomycetes bacterium]|nr:serine/threonine protein kinase [Planctomycetota bacterium]
MMRRRGGLGPRLCTERPPVKICLSCEGVSDTAAARCGHCGAWLLPTDCVHYPVRRGEADAGNPLLGTVVDGKYRLQAVLGRGGLGTVFQAVHTGSLMAVAVKLLHPRFSERPEYRRALLPEARLAATVAHERCARLLDVGEAQDGVAYLAMELVDGETLDVVVRPGPLAPPHALAVLTQIAEALVAIHGAGLVHCDLSPRNVMVALQGGRVHTKVLDFGIARSAAIASAPRARAGELTGFVNPAFAAPEQLAGQPVDARADLYALGMLAWLLLTGGLPVDDADPRRTARAVVAGELRPWPDVPRRLQRLVARCLQLDRAARPPSAQAVLDELRAIGAAASPALARTSLAVTAVAVLVWSVVAAEGPAPFLRPVAGSSLVLADQPLSATTPVQELQSRQLATLSFHFGGFAAGRLRAYVSRSDTVLLRPALSPEVDVAGEVCTLSTLQPQWRDVVQSLLDNSRDGPLDLSFVVPGAAPLGSARLRLDDTPPRIEAELLRSAARTVAAGSELGWRAADDIGLAEVHLEVRWADGRGHAMPLAGVSGELALGSALATALGSTAECGPGEILCRARDRAGNTGTAVVPFDGCDVLAPAVVEVTGPAGEPFVPCLGGRGRLRVRLSEAEAGCTLAMGTDGSTVSLRLSGAGTWHSVEVPAPGTALAGAPSPVTFVVTDPAGNTNERQLPVVWRDRSVRLVVAGAAPGSTTVGQELVLASRGARATVRCSAGWRVVRATIEFGGSAPDSGEGEAVRCEDVVPGTAHLRFLDLPPGAHRLHVRLEEVDAPAGHQDEVLPLRVLPDDVEVRLPAARPRFLPGLLQAGVLAERGDALVQGPGWRVDAEVLPYLGGTLWLGGETLAPVQISPRAGGQGTLLPEVRPVPGRNVLAVELADVLGRPVRVLAGDRDAPQWQQAGRAIPVVADFWWHDGRPQLVGEELLVEFGQPARLRLRLPLPFAPAELGELRLGIAQTEVPARDLVVEGATSVATFEVAFELWRSAAQLGDQPREAFAAQLERRATAYLLTPAGRHEGLEVKLRTVRSTLRAAVLGELAVVPEPLAALRLVPVLAPDGPFAEPVPPAAPPRALFRPQVPVAVRAISDFLLQDRELTWGEARALAAVSAARRDGVDRRLVHADDPLGSARLDPANLLPAAVAAADADRPVSGVSFFQAYACCRLLGLAVAGDPELFRLPLGCELELAAYAAARQPACNGPAAAGHGVAAAAFRAAAAALQRGQPATAAADLAAGDAVAARPGEVIVGLDFGVREWVGDLPHVPGAELVLTEWIGDHEKHLERLAAFAAGVAPPPDLARAFATFGVVRGLALGEVEGLIDEAGARLPPEDLDRVPGSVPGVLRSEQLRRDGRDLLSNGPDPRLLLTGFRVAGGRALVAFLRGQR